MEGGRAPHSRVTSWLDEARAEGLIVPLATGPLLRILGAMIDAAAREAVRPGRSEAAAEARAVVERLLAGLRAPG